MKRILSGKAAWVSVLSSCESQLHSVLDSIEQKAVFALPGGAQELSPLLLQEVLDNI